MGHTGTGQCRTATVRFPHRSSDRPSKVLLPQGSEASKATVVSRKRDHDGQPIGKRHANPLLDALRQRGCFYIKFLKE